MSAAGEPGPPPGSSRRSWRWAIPLTVAVALGVVVAVVDLSPHSSTGSHNLPIAATIDLLPSPGTRSGCIVGTPGVPRPTYALDDAVLQANTYEVPAGTTGHVGMCYSASAGDLLAYANWSEVGAAGGWFSYPQVTYGVNLWDGIFSTYTNMSPVWKLPQSVGAVVNESVWTTATYRLTVPPRADVTGYDLSFDNFFSATFPSQFEVGPFVEVEIFLAHNISYPFEWIPWTTTTQINGSFVPELWDIGYWCHGPDNGTNANVSFDFSLGGQSTFGLASGQVGVNLSAMLAEVEALMPGVTCWTGPTHGFGQFEFDEANLGSEDGAVGGSSFTYNWTVDEETIQVGAYGPVPAGSLGPSGPSGSTAFLFAPNPSAEGRRRS